MKQSHKMRDASLQKKYTMKYKLILLLIALQFGLKSQCVANFTCDLQPNGVVTITNNSIYTGTAIPLFTWDLGDGSPTFTSTSLTQTLSTTYTANGAYTVALGLSQSGIPCAGQDTILQVMLPGCPLTASMTAINTGTGSATVSFVNLTTGTVSGTTYTWNFGDGGTSNLPTPPLYTYGKNGVYGYSLNASSNSTCNAFYYVSPTEAYAIPNLNATVVWEYTTSISAIQGPGGLVNFTIHKHVFNFGFALIHFGDGVWKDYSVDTVFSHIFYDGTYTPTIDISPWFNGNSTGYIAGPITITNNPCYMTSAFSYTTLSGGNVQFSAPAQVHNNVEYFWDFGEGDNYNSMSVNPTHTYASAGSFTVKLVSVDTTHFSTYYSTTGGGPMAPWQSPCQDIDTININITNIPCIANSNFTYYPSGMPHEYYIYPDYPYNVTVANWNWGDGTSYTGPSIYTGHTYTASGFYNICLTVTTSCGSSTTTCINDYFAKGVEGDMITVSVMQPTTTVSIKEETEAETIGVHPNPSSGKLFVSMSKNSEIKEFEVYNAVGDLILKEKPGNDSGNLTIDLSQFSDGVYFLNIRTENKQLRSKFILLK